MDLRVGGKFKLIKKCGSGAFGEIYQGKSSLILANSYLGSNVKTGDDVAIKLVSDHSMSNPTFRSQLRRSSHSFSTKPRSTRSSTEEQVFQAFTGSVLKEITMLW